MANRVVPDRQGLIQIGKIKENLVTEVELPAPGFAGGSYAVLLRRPKETAAYPVSARAEGGKLIWTVETADVAIAGTGKVECRWYGDNGEVAKSQTYMVRIADGLPDPSEAPQEWEGYIGQVARDAENAKSSASTAAQAAEKSENLYAQIKADLAAGKLKGEKGDPGEQGPAGPQGESGKDGKDGTDGLDAPQDAVLFTPQNLTEAQKAQARANINADGTGNWELIKSIKLEEDKPNMYTVDFSGSPLSAVKIITVVPKGQKAGIFDCRFLSGDYTIGKGFCSALSTESYADNHHASYVFNLIPRFGLYESYALYGAQGNQMNISYPSNAEFQLIPSSFPCTAFRYYIYNKVPMIKDTTIRIYGVRASAETQAAVVDTTAMAVDYIYEQDSQIIGGGENDDETDTVLA